jgi:two-component system, cell cycle sensor histidine kinase and response regulator CckA
MPDHAGTRNDGVLHELQALRRVYVQRLPDQLEAMATAFHALSVGPWDHNAATALHRMVHSLSGTSGTYGLRDVSQAARQLEIELDAALKAQQPPSTTTWASLKAAMVQLDAVAWETRTDNPAPTTNAPSPPVAAGNLVHLISDNASSSQSLCQTLGLKGFRVRVFSSPECFQAHFLSDQENRPSIVVLDMAGSENAEQAPSLIQQLGLSAHPGIPLVVSLSQDDLTARIAAARAGARHCLPHPLDPERLAEVLGQFSGGSATAPWRVLLVDDEPMTLQVHALHLRQAGMEVQTLTDPMQTLLEVKRFQPDVLVLDVYMPEANGPEVAAALRESHISPHLAIVFLSAETDMTQQLVALNLGGDDFLIKPVQPSHLVAAVTARARRARQNRQVQQRLETTLYERQREHLALNEHAIVSMTDGNDRITYANDLFCKVSGYSLDEVIGQTHRLIKSDEHSPAFFREMWSTISQGRVWKGEICCKRRDGGLFWVESTITPFVDGEGRPYQYVSIRTDITHIKAAEEALRRQRDMQRMISMAAASLMAAPAHQTAQAIQDALRSSGELLGADQAFLFRVNRDGTEMRNTHYWCASEAVNQREQVRQVPLVQFTWMRAWFSQQGIAVVPDVDQLPEDALPERQALALTRTRAMIASPMLSKGLIAGFVGYSASQPMPSWTPQISELLNVLSEVIGGALARQRAESALRHSESRLSFLVSSSPVTIYTRANQPPYSLNYVSPNVSQLMGLEPAAFTNEPDFWLGRVHPDDRDGVKEAMPRMLDGEVHQHEYRMRMGDGSHRWVQDSLRLARDETSDQAELVGYWMDITERKRIESELSRFNHELEKRVAEQTQSVIESERFARATLDALDARVAILNEDGQVLAVNRAWSEANTAREGSNYLDCCDDLCGLPADGPRPIAEGLRNVLQGKVDHHFHEYTCPKAAEPRWFICRIKRFPGDGAVHVVVSHEDITAMKLIERQQMRSQRLESLGTLAGGVAHDLNNSLAPILMGMDILQDQYPQESKLITMIHTSAKRGADMVRQLLAFAKGVDGKRIALQPAQLLSELEGLMKGSFPKNIDLQVLCDPSLPMVLGDATQLHQILLNLCVNARDAMPHGGTLIIEARDVQIDAQFVRTVSEAKPGRYVCFRVSDTGEGIPHDVLDRIFDPFFSTKSQEKGTGLGLSTVLGIVKGHGGFVQVTSSQGQGSTFSVYLPSSKAASNHAEGLQAERPFQGNGETILFVDDEPAVREVAMTVLKRLNFNPMVAVDGEDALIKATENRAVLQAIVTDMHMPHMDGLAFVHAVRRTLPDVPIILASGRVDDSVAKDFKALGVTARLDKPFSERQLAEKLSELLGTNPDQR